MAVFVATYAYTSDTSARTEVRPAHRAWLGELNDLLVSGPTDAEGAVLILQGSSAAAVEAVLDGDPFALHGGVIGERRVVGWTPVSGSLVAAFPSTS